MRYFFRRNDPPLTRVLFIESGARSLSEGVLRHLHNAWGKTVEIDLVTCYDGLPAGWSPGTTVFRVADYNSPEGRRRLTRELRARNHSFAGMICSGESIMTKWKWLIALRVPAKFFIVNENGDYFWVQRANSRIIRRFMLVRLGLEGEGSLRTIARLLIFPFSLLFLILYALAVHARRRLRMLLQPDPVQ
ncbi:MAG TPA: hypothetical protein VG273_00585 [Bryobacteraceae bacterium]|nr:hypothetical protein [Bryobacteraceae bacterium]